MTELIRTAQAVTGLDGHKQLAAAWNRDADLGYVVPLVIAPLGPVTSNPLMVTGINSMMLLADIAVGVAGALTVFVNILRPNLTAWPQITGGTVSTAVAGMVVITFGSRGRDQATATQGICWLLCSLTLNKTSGAGAVTLNSIRLQSMTRP
jgi:hypothetical protein